MFSGWNKSSVQAVRYETMDTAEYGQLAAENAF